MLRPRREFHPGALVVAFSALLVVALMAFAAAPATASLIAPEQAHSPNAEDITTTYWVVLVVGVALLVAINVALAMAVLRFRAVRGREPARVQSGRGVQARVVGALSLLALSLLVFGIVFTERAREVEPSGPNGLEASLARSAQTQVAAPAETEPLEIGVIGQRWLWRFVYPGGRPGDRTFSYQQLVVPVDTTVILHITSTDVVHRWWVPALGGKADAVPGQTQDTWFKVDEEGIYEGQSAAFSGPSYPTMQASVRAVSPEEYQVWLEEQAADLAAGQAAVFEQVDAAAEAPEEPPAEEDAAQSDEGAATGGGNGGANRSGSGESSPRRESGSRRNNSGGKQ